MDCKGPFRTYGGGGGFNKEERFMKPFTSIQCLKFFLTDGNP